MNNTKRLDKKGKSVQDEKDNEGVKPVKVILVSGGIFVCGLGLYYLLKGKNNLLVQGDSSDLTILESLNPIKKKSSSSATGKEATKATSVPASTPVVPIYYKAIAEEIRKANYDGTVYKVNNVDKVKNSMGALLAALKKINSVKDYELVNREYVANTGLFEVTKSIVTHSLEVYGQYNAYRAMLVTEFLRIGLKQNSDGKWSLSGIGSGLPIVYTNANVIIRGENFKPFSVPSNTLLGEELERDDVNHLTKIKTPNNKIIYAPTFSLIKLS